MKRMLVAALAAACLAAPVLANDNLAGSTLRVTTTSGETFEASFGEDGSYTDSRGAIATWTTEGEELCLHMQNEAGETMSQCGPWNPGMSSGDTWETEGWGPEGTTITIEML